MRFRVRLTGPSTLLRSALVVFCCILTCSSRYPTPSSSSYHGAPECYFSQIPDHNSATPTPSFSKSSDTHTIPFLQPDSPLLDLIDDYSTFLVWNTNGSMVAPHMASPSFGGCAHLISPKGDEGRTAHFRCSASMMQRSIRRQVYSTLNHWLSLAEVVASPSSPSHPRNLDMSLSTAALMPLSTNNGAADTKKAMALAAVGPMSTTTTVTLTTEPNDSTVQSSTPLGGGKPAASGLMSTLLSVGDYSSTIHSSLASIFPDVPPAGPQNGSRASQRSRRKQRSQGGGDHPLTFDGRTVIICQIALVFLVHLAMEHFSYTFEKISAP
ncbi:hypothetical protein H4R33_000194 [Dimargaris cristalligena]|uniref:Uncharacterized protein n=1 Tax=Dimargaris cristalligena TaxID=215637 RepID=A0A4V1J4M7_9FUNG|nr:hypothetical protein H4R33_000194 [Dimargaris cristalligena]RKP36099.1 hypothetical protein BJ085DRAFT_28704 [Dimargaris cristalligena]|eukprot:RKP36099.1 hypothetical protein BJ085DRAFT_28704 [Dimargaris cristalligena]